MKLFIFMILAMFLATAHAGGYNQPSGVDVNNTNLNANVNLTKVYVPAPVIVNENTFEQTEVTELTQITEMNAFDRSWSDSTAASGACLSTIDFDNEPGIQVGGCLGGSGSQGVGGVALGGQLLNTGFLIKGNITGGTKKIHGERPVAAGVGATKRF